MKNYAYWKLKNHRIYTVKEASKILGAHVCTVRSWIEQGLKTVPNTVSPVLIKGKELKSFLKKRGKARKCQLIDNQFYFLRCRQACQSESANIKAEIFKSLLSKGNHKATIHGICIECGTAVRLFSSERIVKKWLDQRLVLKENVTLRLDDNNPSGNAYSQSGAITTFEGV